MIDKKIEEAARRNADKYRNYPTLSDEDRDKVSIGSFMDCAKWMREEFLKDLWHHASEKPNIKQGECCVTCLVKFKNGSTELCVYFRNPEGWVCDDMTPKDFKRSSNPQPIGFSGILLAKRQNSFYCTYFLHNRNVADTKSPYPIKRLEVIRWFNQKSMVFNQSLS